MAIDPQTSQYTQLGGGIAKNSPRIYEMSVEDITTAVIETVGYLDPIAQLDNPVVSRPFADGDFIQIKMTQGGLPNCLLYQVSYNSGADTYTLVRRSMGKVVPPLMVGATYEIVYAGLVNWSGGGTSNTFSVPGALTTDIVTFTVFAVPGGYDFKVSMLAAVDGVSAILESADTSNVSQFFIVVVRSLP
jgi:hypothetical protein